MVGAKRKACATPGCPNVHSNPGHYCTEHRRIRKDTRPNATERGYGPEWRKESAAYLKRHPLCECKECKASGRPRPSTIVDHIKAHKGNMALFWDMSNWRAMAKRCHDRKTVLEDGGFGREPIR